MNEWDRFILVAVGAICLIIGGRSCITLETEGRTDTYEYVCMIGLSTFGIVIGADSMIQLYRMVTQQLKACHTQQEREKGE